MNKVVLLSRRGSSDAVDLIIVDEDEFQARYLTLAFERMGFSASTCSKDSADLCDWLEQTRCADLIVVGTSGKDRHLLDLLGALRARDVMHLVLLTGKSSKAVSELLGSPFLERPFASYQVVDWVEQACQGRRSPAEAPV